MPIADDIAAWHEFFTLLGTAAATLVGLLFVAASVGGRTWSRRAALRAFLSATVVHFASVLLVALNVMLPWRNPVLIGCAVGLIGLFGLAYCALIWRDSVRDGLISHVDLEDRTWYMVVPALCYLLLVGAGGLLGERAPVACALLAGAATVLMFTGIRNAWDITVWIVTRPSDSE